MAEKKKKKSERTHARDMAGKKAASGESSDTGQSIDSDEEVSAGVDAGIEVNFAENATDDGEIESEKEADDIVEQLAEMTLNWQRERASFQNYKRRVNEEKSMIRKYACYDLALDLIRILDYFESSVNFSENLPKEAENVVIGVKYTIDELVRTLESNGISQIQIDEGDQYDSTLMEVVERVERDDMDNGIVTRVQRTGWRLHERVLRPAQVVVTVTAGEQEAPDKTEGGDEEEQ